MHFSALTAYDVRAGSYIHFNASKVSTCVHTLTVTFTKSKQKIQTNYFYVQTRPPCKLANQWFVNELLSYAGIGLPALQYNSHFNEPTV